MLAKRESCEEGAECRTTCNYLPKIITRSCNMESPRIARCEDATVGTLEFPHPDRHELLIIPRLGYPNWVHALLLH